MAITLVGSPTTAANGGEDVSLTITRPTGVASGDQVVIVVALEFGSRTASISGFTAEINQTGGDGRLYIFRKAATGSEPATYTLDMSNGGGNYATVIATAYRGVDSVTPVRASSSAGAAATTTITTGSVTAVSDDWAVVGYAVEGNSDAISFTGPGGLTEVEETPFSGNAAALYYGAATVGSSAYDGTCSETVDVMGGVIILAATGGVVADGGALTPMRGIVGP